MLIKDEKILRAHNEEVIEKEVNGLISILEKGLNYTSLMGKSGVGLACPQIGINKKAAIIRIPPSSYKEEINLNLVNAKIKNSYNPFLFKNEGCLSIDNFTPTTKRYAEVVVTNNLVKPYNFIANGFLAIVIQHELDHLDGILIRDRMVDCSKIKSNDFCPCGSKIKYKKCCKQ